MMNLRSSALAIMLGATSLVALSTGALSQASIDITVNVAPPPLPFYDQPPIPGDGYLWAPGYWAWDQSEADYYWVPGTWVEAPQRNLLWTPGYWGWNDGNYVFYSGYWAPQVGFYGGVDYGHGYGGEGYEGGHWDHGAFFYNRAANNIANVTIKNIYNQTIVINNTSNRASFNGGNGGISARPTAQQQALAKEKHVEETTAQKQHVAAASKDKALFSKQNHGSPEVAATARPGDLKGPGVTHATKANEESPKPATGAGETPKADTEKKPAAQSPASDSTKEAPKPEDRKAEKPSPAGDMKKEAPKAEPMKPEKPATTEMKKDAPKAESAPKSEKPASTEMKREEPKAEPAPKPAKPAATEMKREEPKAEPAPRPEKPAAPEMKRAEPQAAPAMKSEKPAAAPQADKKPPAKDEKKPD
jgi:WXXGXW repeat (2 copies)